MKARSNQNNLNQAIKISLKPSLLLLGLLTGISMLSCVAVAVLPISLFFKCTLVATMICSTFYYTLRDALLLLPWSWQQLEVTTGGELRLTNQRGQQLKPTLAATTFIHPLLVILNIKQSIGVRRWFTGLPPLVLFSDALAHKAASEQHRQLRVWLRWWKHDDR